MVCLSFRKDNVSAVATYVEGFDDVGDVVSGVRLPGVDCASWSAIVARVRDSLCSCERDCRSDERKNRANHSARESDPVTTGMERERAREQGDVGATADTERVAPPTCISTR